MITRIFLGAMTGTSCDGIDVVALEVVGSGLQAQSRLLAQQSLPLGRLGDRLRRVADQVPVSAGTVAELNRALSSLHVEAFRALQVPAIDCAVVHGQTIFHHPPQTWQLIDPSYIAHHLACPVLSDVRSADCALGGQGAPLTPITDWCWFRDDTETRVVINLGGFANATVLPAAGHLAQVRAADVCACNHLLDQLARLLLDKQFDTDGQVAANGTCDKVVYARFRQHLREQSTGGRSLGSGDEMRSETNELLATLINKHDAPVLLRSACEAIAAVIAQYCASCCPRTIDRIIVAGGGTHNVTLVQALAERSGVIVQMSDDFGVPNQLREAMAMARMGALAADGISLSLPAVTGVVAPAPQSGSWVFPQGLSQAERLWRTLASQTVDQTASQTTSQTESDS